MFVGRRDEVARFKALLHELPTGRRARVLGRSRGKRSGAQAEVARSRVVLVHALGWSGKSRLLRQFQEMADGSLPDSPVSPGRVRTVWLDWEDEQRERPDVRRDSRRAGVPQDAIACLGQGARHTLRGRLTSRAQRPASRPSPA